MFEFESEGVRCVLYEGRLILTGPPSMVAYREPQTRIIKEVALGIDLPPEVRAKLKEAL